MMQLEKLDRRITIQRPAVSQSDSGEEVVTWNDVATVWAEKREVSGAERFAAKQLVGYAVRTFRFRYSSVVREITTEHRLIFDGLPYDITMIREIGRREGIEVDAFTKSEGQIIGPPASEDEEASFDDDDITMDDTDYTMDETS